LAVNRPEDIRVARLMIQNRAEVAVARLADVDADLGQLVMSST
jgi:Reductase C-terminal